MNHIGDIISKMRQNKNMTQEEFASRLGVTPQAVSRWERGGLRYNSDKLKKAL